MDLDLQSDGKPVLTGVLSQETCILDRLNEGSFDDTSFSMYWVDYRTGFGTNVDDVNTALQSDGKLLTAGCREYRNNDHLDPGRPAIIRSLQNGLRDTTFDEDGARQPKGNGAAGRQDSGGPQSHRARAAVT